MRLLHSTTLALTDFLDVEVTPYAILSHTWGREEVTYEEMRSPTDQIRLKVGFRKIKQAAMLAKNKGYKYIWIDTCCIDKSSSAELSEAINSMYKWYQNSGVCFAFLSDVFIGSEFAAERSSDRYKWYEKVERCLRSCRWMTRGWTLQELIAPKVLEFYGSVDYLGDKQSLGNAIAEVTGISLEVLLSCDPSVVSVAERMSWAAQRETTRVEDIAYCLMGIFDVNMPLLYGEGNRAFIRLQEEILKSSDDHSLFVWRAAIDSRFCYRGLLARSPNEFFWRSRSKIRSPSHVYDDSPISITNKGIQMTVPLVPWSLIRNATEQNDFEDENCFVAILNCDQGVGIMVVRLTPDQNQYARVDAVRLFDLNPKDLASSTIYIRQKTRLPRNHFSSRLFAFQISYSNFLYGHHGGGITSWDRKISVTSCGKSLGFNQGVENVFELRSLNALDESSKVLAFRLESLLSEKIDENYPSWIRRNTLGEASDEISQYFFGKEGTRNQWTGAVSVLMEWDSQTGAHCFQALYSQDGTLVDDSQLISDLDCTKQSKSHLDEDGWQKRLTIPISGPIFNHIGINMYTKLMGDHPIIAIDIREYEGNPDATY